MASRPSRRDAKVEALRAQGVLHPRPEAVRDSLFGSHEFFDARDLVQVKYEMLPIPAKMNARSGDGERRFRASRTLIGAERRRQWVS
jgi:hypothetical protein